MINKLFFTVIFTFLYSVSLGQIPLGEYEGDNGYTYYFKINTFKTTPNVFGFHGSNEIAKGKYRIENNILFLNYNPIKDHPRAHFEFIKKEPIYDNLKPDTLFKSNIFYVHFQIFETHQKPIYPSAILLLKNEKDQTIYGFSSDSLGHIPEIFSFGNFEGYFLFTSLGNEQFKINTDKLSGYKSSVKVILPKRRTYSDFDGIKKYLIKQIGRDKIVLKSIESKETLVLKRK